MSPADNTRPDGREPRDTAKEPDKKPKARTPDTDMQSEDAGTAEADGGRGNTAQGAMKQQSKTEQERGSRS